MISSVTHGDVVKWKKENPLNWKNHQIQKDIKNNNHVYVTWSRNGTTYKCYYLGRTEESEPWGDCIQLFFYKKQGVFQPGVHTVWMQDIGLGNTPKESQENYMKYNWINRRKKDIHNHIFWCLHRMKNNVKL